MSSPHARLAAFAALALSLLLVAAPANAVTVGPVDDSDPTFGMMFDLSGDLVGSDDSDGMVSVSVGGQTCDVIADDEDFLLSRNLQCFLDSPLTVGSAYHAIVDEDGFGHWDCSIYYEDGCAWFDDYDYKREYAFTYTGHTQALTRYYAPSAASIKAKRLKRGLVRLTCAATREGAARSEIKATFQVRNLGKTKWRTLESDKTSLSGTASMRVTVQGGGGSARCSVAGDWHTNGAVSNQIKVRPHR